MRQIQQNMTVHTNGQGLFEFTDEATKLISECGISMGIAHFYCQHTSASLLIQENADPDVQHDLIAFFRRLVPEGDPMFIHRAEGPDDMPAHVKSALMPTTLTIPIANGTLTLGTWQGIYLFEHRRQPHKRNIVIHAIGH